MTKTRLIRCDITATISVYSGNRYLGMIACPTQSGGPNYPATVTFSACPAARINRDRDFSTEDAAIRHLRHVANA